jgi:hypothetical protein
MDIPAGIAAQTALTQQAIALSVMKQSADMQMQLVAMLDEALANVPVSATRGTSLNMQA